jgi:hypothetical protein
MTPEEELRRTHINGLADAFIEELKALGVESFIVATSFDDTPGTGEGRTRAKGVDYVIAQMVANIAATLPPFTFQRLLGVLALNPEFAVQRGETADPVDMAKVN